jgi:tetratricopeptide (TPR) repeat protein
MSLNKYNISSFLLALGLIFATGPTFANPADPAPLEDNVKEELQENILNDSEETAAAGMQIGSGVSGSYLSSQFAKSSGNIDEAIRYLRKVHKSSPDNLDVANQLEGIYMLSGNIDEAVVVAATIRKADPQDPISSLLLAISAIKKNKLDEAVAMLDNDFSGGRGQLWLPLVMGWIDVSRDKLKKPLTIEELTANVGKAAPIVNYHLALINNKAGFTQAAAANFKNAIEDAQNPPARMMEMLLAFYAKNNKPELLTPLVETYRAAHPQEQQAVAPLIVNAQQGVAEVLFTMGSIMQAAGLSQDGIIYLQMAQYLEPDLTVSLVALGDAYTELKLYDYAKSSYAKVPPGTRFYKQAQLRIAIGYDRMDKLPEALSMLDKIAKQDPSSTDALVTKADLLRLHKRFPEAVGVYSLALQRTPEPSAQHWALYFARGGCLERLGKWPQAQADLRRALELMPNQPDVMNYLGFGMLVRNENIKEARAMIEKAVELRPNDPAIIDSMGWALYMDGDFELAVAYIEKAAELLPNDPTIYDHLGDVYWRLGRKTEARYQWERSLTYSPDEALVDSIQKKLKDGLPKLAYVKPKAAVKAEILPPIARE